MEEPSAKKAKVDLPNRAFVFLKPHAQVPKARAWAKECLEKKGFVIEREGQINGPDIDAKKLIDQHYYAIASKATILSPKDLPVPKDKFKEKFKIDWDEALAAGQVFNAMEACKHFSITSEKLQEAWRTCNDEKAFVKFGGGFYCGELALKEGAKAFVFNPFFMAMRGKFTAEAASIHYFVVSWSKTDMPWADFRGKLLGATNPKEAEAGSLRRESLEKWQELELPAEPTATDNTMHASASPLESLSEQVNWLETEIAKDAFGAALLAKGVPEKVLKEWFLDPRVTIDEGGEKKSIFDTVEDMDSDECLEKLVSLYQLNSSKL